MLDTRLRSTDNDILVLWPPKNAVFGHLVTGPLETNCYIIGCKLEHEAVIVDPGAMLDSQLKEVERLMAETEVRLKYIVNTHGHADHIAGNRRLKELTKARILIHPLDSEKLTDASRNGSGLFGVAITSLPADELVEESHIVRFGKLRLQVIHTPGHTPGSISLLGDGFVFTGDTLFSGSIGVVEKPNGTPDPGGNYDQEVESIRKRLLILADDIRIFPGHGPPSTIGRERQNNPFLR